MIKHEKKVIVVATSRKTRGGITEVIQAHAQTYIWEKYDIRWIETHIDRSIPEKVFYFLRSWLNFIIVLPQYDLIHIHVATYFSLLRKSCYFLVAKLYRKKILIHFHSSTPDTIFKPCNKGLYRYVFSKSDMVLVLSNKWKEWIYEALGLNKNIEILYNPVHNIRSFEKAVVKKDYILFAGSIIPRKGYQDIIRSFSMVADKHREWKLIFAGEGEISQATQLVKKYNLEKQVEFRGWVSGKEKEQLFREASIFCLASYSEGFPMAVLDAWSYCLPVICTPVGGLPDVIKDGVNVLVFEPGNIEKLASLLEILIRDPHLRNKIAQESYRLSQTTFTLEHICKKLDTIYNNILSTYSE